MLWNLPRVWPEACRINLIQNQFIKMCLDQPWFWSSGSGQSNYTLLFSCLLFTSLVCSANCSRNILHSFRLNLCVTRSDLQPRQGHWCHLSGHGLHGHPQHQLHGEKDPGKSQIQRLGICLDVKQTHESSQMWIHCVSIEGLEQIY